LLGGVAAAVTAAIVVAGARLRWQEMHQLQAATMELEHERELGKRRADVLASVSHDLRSPLAGVVLQASMLEEQAEAEGREELLAMAAAVSRGATRAALLVDELLDFARMESGGMQLEIEPLDLCAVVKEAVEDVRIARPSFAVEIDDQMGEDELVKGDEERLRAVFRNVMDNAARYGKGPYRVRIVPDGTRVDVHLEDGGPGIPESERSAIFQKYERGSTAAGNKGTGLGLYFSRELVALHGGTLAAGASPMGGADFVVSLPRSLNGHSA
jgi:signal transduction histidine kinase